MDGERGLYIIVLATPRCDIDLRDIVFEKYELELDNF